MNEISFRTTLYAGTNSLDRLVELQEEKIFIVTDPFIVESGMIDHVVRRIKQHANEYCVFSDIVPDPPVEKVVAGVKEMAEFKPTSIIAIGGGSAIDAAKAMKDFAMKIYHMDAIRVIVIPTTSGTGSEVTSFSVITDNEKNIKYPLVSDTLLPDEAILDAELVKTVPKTITADTGMDVLTHAIEAYVATGANDFSDALAEKAVRLVLRYLPLAYQHGEDIEAREKMHHASTLAGMAFNLAGLGINHSIAHACGGKLHIPHGRLNTIILPYVIEYNASLTDYRQREFSEAAMKYNELAKAIGLSPTNVRSGVKGLMKEIEQLRKKLNMPSSLKECGIDYNHFQKEKGALAEAALQDGCTNTNPIVPCKEDMESIIESMY
ncbi:1-propanol dehydrogenase PduQ [Pontibacillus litoralis]|uniref:Alcohol dehydrogenase n=1 Tax=Pontibacillus litoralis JSM 072002 TaxID=1385512 RepID=A0A0A5G097_9BACI|nr:1-propanol dehydrogenase PduQ [Pontibacillus litoralis]KGX84498.1 alcohol dehydrogenase [Pontibacillus litoralis JSM 072002]